MNAIILAAGMGTRLRPLTNNQPKCMVPVCGTPMIERQIQFLHNVGIQDITLVSGYKAEKLQYLKEKYKLNIVHNSKYDVCNNIYSLYIVKDIFADTFILEGDVYMHKNCLPQHISQSTYFSRYVEDFYNEWQLITNQQQLLSEIKIGSGNGNIMSGISYWTTEDATLIKQEIEQLILHTDYTNLFWDNAVLNIYPQLNIRIQTVNDIYEIDTVNELKAVEQKVSI